MGEAWGTLKGDRIHAIHGLFMGLSYALYKSAATQLHLKQLEANRTYVSHPRHGRARSLASQGGIMKLMLAVVAQLLLRARELPVLRLVRPSGPNQS